MLRGAFSGTESDFPQTIRRQEMKVPLAQYRGLGSLISWACLLLSATLAHAELFVTGQAGVGRYDESTGAGGLFIPAAAVDPVSFPRGITISPDGSLLVGSAFRIAKFDASTGASLGVFVPSLLGSGQMLFDIRYGPDRSLYAALDSCACIRRYDGTSGAFIDDFVASGSGDIAEPLTLAFSANGQDLVVADDIYQRVHRYDGSTGAFVDLFIPSGSGGLGHVGQMAFGPGGDLFVASGFTNSVLRYSGTDGAFEGVFATGNGLSAPAGLAFGSAGELYVTSTGDDRIYVYASDGQLLRSFATTGMDLGIRSYLALSPPIPEPEQYLMLCAGLALLAGCLRRRIGSGKARGFSPGKPAHA